MDENKIIEVNELLRAGKSLNQLEKNGILECSRKAFKNRADKLNYIYDDKVKQFIKFNSDFKVVITGTTTNKSNGVTDSVIKNNTALTSRKAKDKTIKSKEKDLLLESLESRIKILEDIVLQSNTSVTSDNFTIELKTDIITRSFKVSQSVIKDFNNLAENKFNMYNKQDLLNKALIEFIEKYKK